MNEKMYICYELLSSQGTHFAGPYEVGSQLDFHRKDIEGYEHVINVQIVSEEEKYKMCKTIRVIHFE